MSVWLFLRAPDRYCIWFRKTVVSPIWFPQVPEYSNPPVVLVSAWDSHRLPMHFPCVPLTGISTAEGVPWVRRFVWFLRKPQLQVHCTAILLIHVPWSMSCHRNRKSLPLTIPWSLFRMQKQLRKQRLCAVPISSRCQSIPHWRIALTKRSWLR